MTGFGTSSYDLDFGTVAQGSSQEAQLAFLNNNPLAEQAFTDLLSSKGTVTSGSGFTISGDSVSDLLGAETQGGFDVGLPTSTPGSFDEMLTFDVESSNSSGYDMVIGDVTLTLEGTVGTVTVPAPLIGRGFPALLAVGGVLFGAKLLERGKKRRSLRTVLPHAAA